MAVPPPPAVAIGPEGAADSPHQLVEEEIDLAAPEAPEPGLSGADDVGVEYDPAVESAYRAEARARGEIAPAAPASGSANDETGDVGPLPPLEELVNRIPTGVRETLDELFRAKFVTVRRIPTRQLKR